MRPLVVTEFITLDGVVEGPGGGDHPHAGWTFKDVPFDPAAYEIKGREQEEAGALLLGGTTYREFAPIWPTMEDFARYNSLPKYVVSTTLTDADLAPDWPHTTILRSVSEVAALKEGDGGPLLVHGSATLAQGLAAAGLVDRYTLLEFPLVLGSGTRLFADDGAKAGLTLVEHATYGNGVRLAIYDVRREEGIIAS